MAFRHRRSTESPNHTSWRKRAVSWQLIMQTPFNTTGRVRNEWVWRGIILLLMSFFGMHTMSEDLNPVIDQSLVFEGSALYMRVTVKNESGKPLFIEDLPRARESTLNQEFEIASDDGEVPYVGVLAKRRPYQQNDFVELGAGGGGHLMCGLILTTSFLQEAGVTRALIFCLPMTS